MHLWNYVIQRSLLFHILDDSIKNERESGTGLKIKAPANMSIILYESIFLFVNSWFKFVSF